MIRSYLTTDKNALLDLLQMNIPDYFAPSELKDFDEYLDNHREDYFVVEINNRIVGCGGVNYEFNINTAIISWDLLHPEWQRKGIGTLLLQMRIDLIKANSRIDRVIVRTSQMSFPFYEKKGFVLEYVSEDFWADGYDLYMMNLKLKS